MVSPMRTCLFVDFSHTRFEPPPLAVYFIRRGQLAASEPANQLVTSVLLEGQFFGTESLSGSMPTLEVRAGTDCELFALYAIESASIMQQFPQLLQLIDAQLERDRAAVASHWQGSDAVADVEVKADGIASGEGAPSDAPRASTQLDAALRGQHLTLSMLQVCAEGLATVRRE